MPSLDPNPNVEAQLDFDLVKPGVYRMRVEEITEQVSKAGNTCWKVRLAYADPSGCTKLDGSPAQNPGQIFDGSLIVLPKDKQWRTRSFVEACGRTWGEIRESDELIGSELNCKIAVEEYEGKQSNKVDRYLKP